MMLKLLKRLWVTACRILTARDSENSQCILNGVKTVVVLNFQEPGQLYAKPRVVDHRPCGLRKLLSVFDFKGEWTNTIQKWWVPVREVIQNFTSKIIRFTVGVPLLPGRYVSELPFPAYAFVPGRQPHPVTDARGHSFGQAHAVPAALNPEQPFASREFLFAIDLFNAGFYWEAHEAWEGLWVAAGRSGNLADFLKGLIKLAAAGVKAREGQSIGVQRHAKRAMELFQSVVPRQSNGQKAIAGLALDDLIHAAQSLVDQPIVDQTPSVAGCPVLPLRLSLIEN